MTRFEFGDNRQSFAANYTEDRRAFARAQLERLVGSEIRGATFLDIGCGSGLHSLAALDLGAEAVTAIDIDPVSVATAEALLGRYAAGKPWQVRQSDILSSQRDLDAADIVYAWGVLHHTGDLRRALRQAANLVRPGGLLVVAIYRKTPLCRAWRAEKWIYTNSTRRVRSAIEALYRFALSALLSVRGTTYQQYREGYAKGRGMSLEHDIKDWLGGYPYESMSIADAEETIGGIGLAHERTYPAPIRYGLLGSACDEYVYRRPTRNE